MSGLLMELGKGNQAMNMTKFQGWINYSDSILAICNVNCSSFSTTIMRMSFKSKRHRVMILSSRRLQE